MKNNTIAIFAFWGVEKVNKQYFCPFSHWIYLDYICKLYKEVILVSPVKHSIDIPKKKTLLKFKNLAIKEMPYATSYLNAQKFKNKYKETVLELNNTIDVFYSRVPDPFSWMPIKYSSKPCIMHYVGDIIDATKNNINWSWLKKFIMLTGYYPEMKRIEKASKKAIVYTNGMHIANKLENKGIAAIPVISSTVNLCDMPKVLLPLKLNPIRLVYVGYLRYAKGIDTIISVLKKLKEHGINFSFDIIGDGEMYNDLFNFIAINNLEEKVKLHGHIDDREHMFNILRNSDVFFFPSLSEGSPRVVIEAMSQGLPVLSTPVGSLPDTFKENEEIYFFPFNDANTAFSAIMNIIENQEEVETLRIKAFNRVKQEFTINKFIKRVFSI